MTAPWSVKLDQDIFLVIKHDVLVVLGDNHGYRAFLLLRDGLGLDAGLDLAVDVLLNELAQVFLGDLCSAKGEFLVLGGVLDGKSRPLADFQVQVPRVCTESLGINGCKIDLALVLLSKRLELGGELGTLLGGLCEDVRKRNTRLDTIVSPRTRSCEVLGSLPPCTQHTSRVRLHRQGAYSPSVQIG